MSNQLISYESLTLDDILKEIKQYVATLENAQDLKDSLSSSALGTMYELVAGLAQYNRYYTQVARREATLKTATQDTSVFQLARRIGYNISRALAPMIKVQYNATATIYISEGLVLGSYGDLDIVYMGKSRYIEKGDQIEAYIGKHKSQSRITNPATNSEEFILEAEDLKYLSQTISVSLGSRQVKVSRMVESYITSGEVVDFSLDYKSTQLLISNKESRFGVWDSLTYTQHLSVGYLETNGYESIVYKDLDLSANFLFIEVLSEGSAPESIANIKTIAPFYFATLRRAVTLADYNVLARAHSLVKDAIVIEPLGIPAKWSFEATQVPQIGEMISISFGADYIYQVSMTEGLTLPRIVELMAQRINAGGMFTAETIMNTLYVTSLSAKKNYSPMASNNVFSTPTTLATAVPPPCCTLELYYIKSTQGFGESAIPMTDTEKTIYANYLFDVKMAGTSIIMAPAQSTILGLKVEVALHTPGVVINDQDIETLTRDAMLNLLRTQFAHRINFEFTKDQIYASLAQTTLDNNQQPIKSLRIVSGLPNDLEFGYDKYFDFNLEVEFI